MKYQTMTFKHILNIRNGLRDYLVKYPGKGLVLGMSGGIDSTVCAALASSICQHLKRPLIGRSITIESNSLDEIERAKLAGTAFCAEFNEDNLTKLYEGIRDFLWDITFTHVGSGKVVELPKLNEFDMKVINGNIKARLRMITLYHIAAMRNCIVLSTDNLTEFLLGFWTLHGDVGDIGMIQELSKTQVYEIAEILIRSYSGTANQLRREALRRSADADATDGLGITSTDIDQIMPDWREHYENSRKAYEAIDRIFGLWFGGHQTEVIDSTVIAKHKQTEYKRNNPFNFPLSLILGEHQNDQSN